MANHLMILEVSQKQAYIFGSRKLRDNIRRSEEIRYVTSPEFFALVCPEDYSGENLVYSGGGHTVLQFDDLGHARRFARRLTEQVLRDFPAMELFVKICPYAPDQTPGENLSALSAALEAKKARRQAANPLEWSIPGSPGTGIPGITAFPSWRSAFRKGGL